MNKLIKAHKNSGFTLIELLIVIVIIGILAGVIITVIDPAGFQEKARQTVLRTNVEKGCLALFACAATTTDARLCDEYREAGIKNDEAVPPFPTFNGTPTGSTYVLNDTGGDTYSAAAAAGDTLWFRGILGSCEIECEYDFGTSDPTPLSVAACVIGAE